MNRTLIACFGAAALTFAATLSVPGLAADDAAKPKLETLLKSKLARVADTEVIVSRVTLGPNAALPKHWHPGEEFAYVITGRVTLMQPGKPDVVTKAGDVLSVPLRQVHAAKTGSEGAVILVFRVHESGKPERVMAK
jgi:quercetin dioxygenase-like cupin family protein